MLQSEFYERTKVNLTGEEYVKVETLYNEVHMDKDEFCKQWLKLRNNPLMKETIEAFYESQQMIITIAKLENEIKKQKEQYESEIEKVENIHSTKMKEFAKRIIRANEDGELRVYDVIEEEYGLPLIIKTKREAGIPLSEGEIDYMVGKL